MSEFERALDEIIRKNLKIRSLKREMLNDKKKLENFHSVYYLYKMLHQIYNYPPEEVSMAFWNDKVISSLTAQPYLNLPKNKDILYSGKISKKALSVVEKKGSLPKARKGSGDNAITNEHYFPRKLYCRGILSRSEPLEFDEFVSEWWEKGGVYHITTKSENAKLQTHIEKKMKEDEGYDPMDWGENYSECKIELVDY